MILSHNSYTFYKHQKKKKRRRRRKKNPKELSLENEGARELVPLFVSNDQESTSPERHQHSGRNEVVHHLTRKLFSQGKVVPVLN
jgi:hypothetical protein